MSEDVRIVLVGAAKAAHDKMLIDVRADGKTTINSSKLINWIVSDYFEHSFQRRKKKLCKEHFNSRKCVIEAMKNGDPEEMRRALQEAARNLAKPNHTRRGKRKVTELDMSNAQKVE